MGRPQGGDSPLRGHFHPHAPRLRAHPPEPSLLSPTPSGTSIGPDGGTSAFPDLDRDHVAVEGVKADDLRVEEDLPEFEGHIPQPFIL